MSNERAVTPEPAGRWTRSRGRCSRVTGPDVARTMRPSVNTVTARAHPARPIFDDRRGRRYGIGRSSRSLFGSSANVFVIDEMY